MDIYQQLGQAKGPSVVGKVFLAFVLPLLVFIVALLAAEYLLEPLIAAGGTRMLAALVLAAAAVTIAVALLRKLTRKPVGTADITETDK